MMLVRQNKDSLVSSDCYLTRVHLRRPLKNDVVNKILKKKAIIRYFSFALFEKNIEYTTMPDFTHVISSIETEV